MMQRDQFSGVIDRALAVLATVFLGWFVKKGYLGESEAATLVPAIVLLPSIIWGYYVNSNKALLQSAANVPGTVIVTTPTLAKDTPAEKNIVSNEATKERIAAAVDKAATSQKEKDA